MRKWIPIVSLLASCHGTTEVQREKIVSLQKRLEQAEKDQKKVSQEVVRLMTKIDRARLQLIRKQVDEYERTAATSDPLFIEEREVLYRLIQSGQMPQAMEAQVELDRILRMITERSNDRDLSP